LCGQLPRTSVGIEKSGGELPFLPARELTDSPVVMKQRQQTSKIGGRWTNCTLVQIDQRYQSIHGNPILWMYITVQTD
jgi:hypothetical protein